MDHDALLLPPFAHGSGPAPGLASGAAPDSASDSGAANRRNMALLVQLRWIAVAGQVATILVVELWLGIPLPLAEMAVVLAALVLLNLATQLWLRRIPDVSGQALLVGLVLDVAALTAQLWLSGGATNPFASLYLLQVTLGAVLVDRRSAWVLAGLTCTALLALAWTHRPLHFPGHDDAAIFSLHVAGMLACFLLDAILLVVFVTRVSENLRARDARLAALRQRAAEESHIVRMGLLASGAAHELGTPLASLSVILGDWRRMPAFAASEELGQELEEMQLAVDRCKSIVTGILLSAGEARGEAGAAITLGRFVAEIAGDWATRRGTTALALDNRVAGDGMAVVLDAVIRQAVVNVLDNALEASPGFVGVVALRRDDSLVIRVSDAGPGFPPDMLADIGRPYRSTRGRPGGGLGLFLVVNVLRKLGGSVAARNLPAGGAEVTLALPLPAFAITEAADA
ncbi:MAG: HAMP domain-containing histidine kinase [Rhizobiales bacterium]|nr:HAMP domain-containing histidine kinase [Hyphomicrobiales bacterium]